MRALPPPNDGPRPGGQGGGASSPGTPVVPGPSLWEGHGFSRSDARLIDQAVRGRWPMSPAMREKVVATLMHVATADPWGTLFDGRTMVAAAKALLDADKLNLEAEAGEVKAPEIVIDVTGRERVDFSQMTDDELERYIERGGDA